ncbi:hypothetical protein NFI96_012568 [Prochilodus magdalenae]|nr:hypothetical protein NFI96_012568 [Prochilodus magdalenae]
MSGRKGKHWVLLAAGSKGWTNYRHQANVCHAFQMVHCNGIPNEQVVVMMYDDIGYNEKNPFPGEIVNEPNGPNVYPGVLKDYTGDDVSAGNFLAVLCGNEAGVNKQAGGPVKIINSDENDTIFVYLSDHGAAGVFAFPRDFLHASDLVHTINEMAERHQFSKMVIYIESCSSGSMIDHLPKNAQVYGVSASTPYESHSACFFDEDRLTFLAGEFTACWLLHTKMSDLTRTTLQDQFLYLQQKVTESTACQYGNNELSNLFISDFLGFPDSRKEEYDSHAETFRVTDLTPALEVPLIIYQKRIQKEKDSEKKRALEKDYHKLLQTRLRTEKAVQAIAKYARPDQSTTAVTDRSPLTQLHDMKDVAEHFRQTFREWHEKQDDLFVLSHLRVFVDLLESGVGVARSGKKTDLT